MSESYKDSSAPTQSRVEDLLSRMTVKEKLAQLRSCWFELSPDGNHQPNVGGAFVSGDRNDWRDRLRFGTGQITRPLGTTRKNTPWEGVKALNLVQEYLVNETRLGIPAISHEECLAGLMCPGSTMFPGSLNMAATWDPDLIEQIGAAIGQEALSIGCHQGLAPVLDVSRDMRWGRTEETFGEDPYLVGVMGVAYVTGLQGQDERMLATLKHYVGHSFSEGGRNHAPVHVGDRELFDVFMLPFEMAVKLANARSVMPAYHDIDGQPVHSDHELLTEVLRGRWGFTGLVVADYAGVNLLAEHHHVACNPGDAAVQAFSAGLDIELPSSDCINSLNENDIEQLGHEKIDEIVTRILTEKFRLGLFEHPYVNEEGIDYQSPTRTPLAYDCAAKSITLLENKDGALPLTDTKYQGIAVVGPTSDDALAHLIGYSFPVHLIHNDVVADVEFVATPLDTLKAKFPGRVTHSRGCDIFSERKSGAPTYPGEIDESQSEETLLSSDRSGFEDAIQTAETSDVVLAFFGDLPGLFQSGTVGEGSDAGSLILPGVQQELLEGLVATGKPVIVILSGGRLYNLQGVEDDLAGLVVSYAGGQAAGEAIVDVLTGKVNPSGKLPLSIPKEVGAMPYYYNHKLKSGGTPIAPHFGSRYPFGYGQSYSDFEIEDLKLLRDEVSIDGDIQAQVKVTNTSDVDGHEVVQVYVHQCVAKLTRPIKELKAFEKVFVRAGESTMIKFTIPVDMLNYTLGRWERVVEPGEFDILIGTSSEDLVLSKTIKVIGDEIRLLPQEWRMQSSTEFV